MSFRDHYLGRFARCAIAVIVSAFPGETLCKPAQLVTDDATNLQALRQIFPNMRISVLPKQSDEKPSPVIDPLQRVIATVQSGLAHGHDYDVIGPVAKNEENSASDVVHSERSASEERQVRMELYRWNAGTSADRFLVAVLRYTFSKANPPRCCQALGKVVLLSDKADRVLDALDRMPYAFTMFTSLRFLRLDRTGAEKLMIGADFSGVGTIGINSAVFDVSRQKLNPLLWLTTMVRSEANFDDLDVHTMTLDERRTVLAKGERFFFTRKTYASGKQLLTTPRIETVSYPVGTGIPLDW